MRYFRPLKKAFINGSALLTTEIFRQKLLPPPLLDSPQHEYPILLMHGFMGFTTLNIFNRRLLDYFNGAESAMINSGFGVFASVINPMESPAKRAQMWAVELDRVLYKTGAKKVHIIAHGQAAIDAKILACRPMMTCNSVHGEKIQGMGFADKIASMTTLGGPHLGTPLADDLQSKAPQASFTDLFDYLAIIHQSTLTTVKRCLENLSRDFMMNTFNPSMQIPSHIPCYLVAANPVVEKNTSMLLDRTWKDICHIAEYDGGGDNDGFVPLRSALYEGNETLLAGTQTKQWQSLGQVTTDHFGLVGNRVSKNAQFNYLAFVMGLAQHGDLPSKQHTQMSLNTNGCWQRKTNYSPAKYKPVSDLVKKKKVPEM